VVPLKFWCVGPAKNMPSKNEACSVFIIVNPFKILQEKKKDKDKDKKKDRSRSRGREPWILWDNHGGSITVDSFVKGANP